ncbi:hypothetical protein ABT160_14925 [Streptomyces sp. NPDC001941]|uniref:hypothetical protein n=1 Tax=Streptomyces sp. NPDC001941 TaxID=3154659 RepID=UPI00331A8E4A
MSATTLHPSTRVPGRQRRAGGATASGAAAHSPHRVGNALRAVKVFAGAVVSVAVLGEYAEDAGVRRR